MVWTRSTALSGVVVPTSLALLLLAACSSDAVSGGPYSCDFPGSQHVCLDYSCATLDDTPSKCTAAGGTLVSACGHDGAVGGCTILLTRAGGCTRTEWDYYGMTSTIMQSCAAGDGTYRTP